MSIRTENEVPQRVATPAFLHQRLQSFRIGRADRQTYVLRDTLQGKNYDFEPWQFFTLEVLPGCTDEEKLASVFEDRFGYRMTLREFEQFFASIADANLFNEAAGSHPLLARFSKKTYVVEGETARAKSFQTIVAEQPALPAAAAGRGGTEVAPAPGAVRPAPNPAAKAPAPDETLPAGMHGAPDFDPRASRWMWVLFNPTWLLKIITPLVWPLRQIIYLIPLMLLGALVLSARHAYEIEGDLTRLLQGFGFAKHWVVSLLTVNLAVVCTTAVLAFKYRATVSGFGIALIMGFYPRFATRVSHLDQLSRVERMWLHGAPMLVRMLAFSLGIYLWFGTRATNEDVATVALAVAVTGGMSLLFSANPLIKSSGYHLLAAFTNEPHLRGKAFKTLLNKLRGGAFKEANELLLATYAIATAAFMFVMVAGAAAFTGFALHQLHLGGSAIILATVVAFVLLRKVSNYFRRVEVAYDRSLQFDRWRRRTHRQDEPSEEGSQSSGSASYVWRAVLITLLIVMFLPYGYRAGGEFVIYPKLKQEITTDVSGRIEEVFFDGGEEVEKGTVVARLATHEAKAQANVLEKKMAEQEAVIGHLELLPRPEHVQVARMALDVEKTRIEFSKIQLERVKKVADQGYAAMEELDETRRQLEVDTKQLAEKQAALEVAKLGPTEFEIAAAQAELESLRAQREVYLDRIRRSELIMPFDGRLLTLHLKQKGNSYYESGDVLATAEESGSMTAEIEVPEAETEYLEVGSKVRFTPIAYSSEEFVGTVVHIDWTITEKPFGNVIKVIAALEDESGRLKSGMTGYAKVEGPELLVWEAFSRQIVRFFEVQVWSWIP